MQVRTELEKTTVNADRMQYLNFFGNLTQSQMHRAGNLLATRAGDLAYLDFGEYLDGFHVRQLDRSF